MKAKHFVYLWLVMLLLHVGLLNMPFIGNDCWRNAQTYSVARNFVEEGSNITTPRYDMREELTGGTYPGEFPLQTYTIALAMKILGINIYTARFINLLYSILSALFIFLIVKKLFPNNRLQPWVTTSLFSVHSLLGFLVTAIMPEMTCFTLGLAAIWAYISIQNIYTRIVVVTFLTTLSTLVKPTGYLLSVFIPFIIRDLKIKHILECILYFVVPALILKMWIHHTMQYEVFPYKNNYAVTHHYARKFSDFLKDFNLEMVWGAIEKTFVHGINVAGISALVFIFKNRPALYKTIKLNTTFDLIKRYKAELGLMAWIAANFAFLLYSGSVQTHQTYYAGAISIPLLILSGRIVYLFNYKWIWTILILQLAWKLGYLQLAYFKYIEKWNTVRLEKFADKVSSRKDLFLVYNPARPDFTVLGRIGRRGINVETREDIQLTRKCFDYFYIEKKFLNPEIASELADSPSWEFEGHMFYKLKK